MRLFTDQNLDSHRQIINEKEIDDDLPTALNKIQKSQSQIPLQGQQNIQIFEQDRDKLIVDGQGNVSRPSNVQVYNDNYCRSFTSGNLRTSMPRSSGDPKTPVNNNTKLFNASMNDQSVFSSSLDNSSYGPRTKCGGNKKRRPNHARQQLQINVQQFRIGTNQNAQAKDEMDASPAGDIGGSAHFNDDHQQPSSVFGGPTTDLRAYPQFNPRNQLIAEMRNHLQADGVAETFDGQNPIAQRLSFSQDDVSSALPALPQPQAIHVISEPQSWLSK